METQLPLKNECLLDLCDKYSLSLETVRACLENALNDYLYNSVSILNNDFTIEIYKANELKKIDAETVEKDRLKKILKRFSYYLNVSKYEVSYDKFKYFVGKLTFGNILENMKNGYEVNIDENLLVGAPLGTTGFLPLKFQPVKERNNLSGGEYLAFIITGINRMPRGNLQLVLSRTAKYLPAKLIETELKISHIKTLMRIPGNVTKLKPCIQIPKKTLNYVKELLKGETIICV